MWCFFTSDQEAVETDDARSDLEVSEKVGETTISRHDPSPLRCRGEGGNDIEGVRVVELTIAPVGDSDVQEEESTQSLVTDSNKQRLRILVPSLVAVAVAGMGAATFGTLAGKVGYALSSNVCELAGYGVVDIAVRLNDASQSEQPGTALQLRRFIGKRGLCWVAIALLKGTVGSIRLISLNQKRTDVWQLTPILCEFAIFICRVILVGGAMLRAHRDRRPNVMKFFAIIQFAFVLVGIGENSPYPLLHSLASVFWLLFATVGTYLLVMHIDKGAERRDVQNGYTLVVGLTMSGIQYFVLWIASLESSLGVFVVSAALMLWQKVVLKVTIPITKRCFGDDQRKLWSYIVPAAVLSLELGPCLLFLGSDLRTLEFWLLLMFQEANSVAKNTGKYGEMYVAVRARLNRPVGEEVRKQMNETRATIAPCDNIGEMASPLVIIMAVGLEAVFDGLPIGRAPYFAKNGIMGGWRSARFRGEAVVMMAAVFVIRVAFCYIEFNIRENMRRRDHGADIEISQIALPPNNEAEPSDNDHSSIRTNAAAKSRRSSMAVLYHRIIRSGEAPVQMQFLAFAMFAMQPIIFVPYVALIGKSR